MNIAYKCQIICSLRSRFHSRHTHTKRRKTKMIINYVFHPERYPTFSIKAWISVPLLPSVASTILGLSNGMTSERG